MVGADSAYGSPDRSTMTRRNPFEELEQLFERMSQQVEPGEWGALRRDGVSVDVVDLGDELEVTVDLPGYEREDIELTLSEGTLRIEAERETEQEEREDADVRYVRRERRRESVSRSIRLPEAVEEDEATARYQNGVLTVTLPKVAPDEAGQRIDIE